MANSGLDGFGERERRGSPYAFGRHDASSCISATGGTARGWKVELPKYRADEASPGHGVGLDGSGLEMLGIGVPGGDGSQAPGVASGEGVDAAGEGCAEWVVSFSSSLEHGVTTVKVREYRGGVLEGGVFSGGSVGGLIALERYLLFVCASVLLAHLWRWS